MRVFQPLKKIQKPLKKNRTAVPFQPAPLPPQVLAAHHHGVQWPGGQRQYRAAARQTWTIVPTPRGHCRLTGRTRLGMGISLKLGGGALLPTHTYQGPVNHFLGVSILGSKILALHPEERGNLTPSRGTLRPAPPRGGVLGDNPPPGSRTPPVLGPNPF